MLAKLHVVVKSPENCLGRRFVGNPHMFREVPGIFDHEDILCVEEVAVEHTAAGTHDGLRDAASSRRVAGLVIYGGSADEVRAALSKLGGEYNPRGR